MDTANAQLAVAQPTCLTVDPPGVEEPRFRTFGLPENGQASFTPLVEERLSKEFGFTPFGVSLLRDRWEPKDGLTPAGKVTLGVHFINADKGQRAVFRRAAEAWLMDSLSEYITFEFETASEMAQLRVNFGGVGNWSKVGVQAKYERNLDKPTMNIQAGLPDYVIMHEVGHALGLRHEHQHPDIDIQWRKDVVIEDMSKPPNSWAPEYTRHAIFDRFGKETRCVGDPEPNSNSIMMYDIPATWTKNELSFQPAHVITKRDRRCVRGLYAV